MFAVFQWWKKNKITNQNRSIFFDLYGNLIKPYGKNSNQNIRPIIVFEYGDDVYYLTCRSKKEGRKKYISEIEIADPNLPNTSFITTNVIHKMDKMLFNSIYKEKEILNLKCLSSKNSKKIIQKLHNTIIQNQKYTFVDVKLNKNKYIISDVLFSTITKENKSKFNYQENKNLIAKIQNLYDLTFKEELANQYIKSTNDDDFWKAYHELKLTKQELKELENSLNEKNNEWIDDDPIIQYAKSLEEDDWITDEKEDEENYINHHNYYLNENEEENEEQKEIPYEEPTLSL
ncbi:Mbov_0400 family ICE element protein [Mycoplasmopsis gallinarum]|uniref:Mbov_0400 family ICE element protein n=1 Tax=Mycoplasmopsis gallinarum TaxID=29557 RepID=UPI00048783EE|nr:hypothetical protein [Mycoplasmopsis gallinarum]